MYVYKMLPIDDENSPALHPGQSLLQANAAYNPRSPAIPPLNTLSGRQAALQNPRPAPPPADDNGYAPDPGNAPPSLSRDCGYPGVENTAGRWSVQNRGRYFAR